MDWNAVASAHNSMADEYDHLTDAWYPWLFAQVHEFIVRCLPDSSNSLHALDVGCGTGLQTYLLARAGYAVHGFDIATELLRVARKKAGEFAVEPLRGPPLFTATAEGNWLTRHHSLIARKLDAIRHGRAVLAPMIFEDNAETYDFGSEQWDVVNCCGSVLSFIERYDSVLTKMATGLRSGGRLFLEVEQKRNPDLLWPFVDVACCGGLEYEQSLVESWRNLWSSPGVSSRVDYPFELHSGEEVTLALRLFSVRELERLFRHSGLRIVSRIGIHQATNLVPSTLLHKSDSPRFVRGLFNILRPIDGLVAGRWPFWRLGCSVMYCLEKV